MTKPEGATGETDAAGPARDDLARLVALASAGGTPEATIRDAAAIVAEQFGSPIVAVSVRLGAREYNDTVERDASSDAGWRRILEAMALDVRTTPRAIGRLYTSQPSGAVATMAAPIVSDSGGVSGSLAVITACATRGELEARVTELRAVCAAVSTALAAAMRARPGADAGGAQAAGAIGRASAYAGITELAFALTNNLRNKLGCDQVIMGMPRGQRIRITAISGLDDVKPRSPGTAAVREALEETLDERRVLCAQNDDAWQGGSLTTGHRLHRAWHESAGNASVASVPLFSGDEVVAVLGLRRRSDEPFTREEIENVQKLVGPFGPAIPVVNRATRGIVTHAVDAAASTGRRLFSRQGWGHRLVAVAMMCFAAWFLFGTMPFRVSVNAVLTPQDVTQLSAPFAGTLELVAVRSGDRVEAGQVLCQFDTGEIELQAAEARAEIEALGVEIDRALATRDIGAATLAAARRDAAEAKLGVYEHRIAAGTVRAPADGTIIGGDLRERVGQLLPLGEPLLRFAPEGAVRVELLASEGSVDEFHAGLTGAFSPTARPGERRSITVQRVSPSAEVRDGQNVFIAEATIDDPPAWMRLGMEGVARVEVEDRPVWWVALHRVSDFFRMRLWI